MSDRLPTTAAEQVTDDPAAAPTVNPVELGPWAVDGRWPLEQSVEHALYAAHHQHARSKRGLAATYLDCANSLCVSLRQLAGTLPCATTANPHSPTRLLAHALVEYCADPLRKGSVTIQKRGIGKGRPGSLSGLTRPVVTYSVANALWRTIVHSGDLSPRSYDRVLHIIRTETSPRVAYQMLGSPRSAALRDLTDVLDFTGGDHNWRAAIFNAAIEIASTGYQSVGRENAALLLGAHRDLLDDVDGVRYLILTTCYRNLTGSQRAANDALLAKKRIVGTSHLAQRPTEGEIVAALKACGTSITVYRPNQQPYDPATIDRWVRSLLALFVAKTHGKICRFANAVTTDVLRAALDGQHMSDIPAPSGVTGVTHAPAHHSRRVSPAELLGALVITNRTEDGVDLTRLPTANSVRTVVTVARQASLDEAKVPVEPVIGEVLRHISAGLGNVKLDSRSSGSHSAHLLAISKDSMSDIRSEMPAIDRTSFDFTATWTDANGKAHPIAIECDGAQHAGGWHHDVDLSATLHRMDTDQQKNRAVCAGTTTTPVSVMLCVSDSTLKSSDTYRELDDHWDLILEQVVGGGSRWVSITELGATGPSRTSPVSVQDLERNEVGDKLVVWSHRPGSSTPPHRVVECLPEAVQALVDSCT